MWPPTTVKRANPLLLGLAATACLRRIRGVDGRGTLRYAKRHLLGRCRFDLRGS
jgi:hypothetical protein